MRCARIRTRGHGFTLLEVLLAVAIVALVTLTIYRFLEGNLNAIRLSTEMGEQSRAMTALVAVLQSEMNGLPAGRGGAILGEAHKFGSLSSDELQWRTGAGNGLFANQAVGDYQATLLLSKTKEGKSVLGLNRVAVDGDSKSLNWLPLIDDVKQLRIRYFDSRLSAWLERWTDRQARPALVRLEIFRATDLDPLQVILSVPETGSTNNARP